MYQFDVDSTTQKTTISSLASSPYGFRTPTFGDFLSRVGNQIDTLLEDLEL